MAGPPNNIPLRSKGYLESGIGLITTLILTLDPRTLDPLTLDPLTLGTLTLKPLTLTL